MPLDPNIALQVGQPIKPIDPMAAYGQVLTLKNLIDQQQMNGLQMQHAQRAADKEMRLADLARSAGGDTEKFQRGYFEIDPLGATELGIKNKKAGFEQTKMEREAEEAKYKMLGKRIELVGQALGALPDNPTYEQAVAASRWLTSQGIQHDESEIPKDPALLPDYIQQQRTRALSAKEQLEANRPRSQLGQLLADSNKWEQDTRRLMDDRPANIDPSNMGQGGDIQAPRVVVDLPPNPYLLAIKKEQGLDPNKPFTRDERGRVVPNKDYQDYAERNAKAGATTVNVQNNPLPLGKTAEGKVDEGLLDTSAALMRLSSIRKEYKPEWSQFDTQAGMTWNHISEKYLGGKINPADKDKFTQYTKWRKNSLENVNLTIKQLTGSAMGKEEANRIIGTLPSPDDSPSEFQAKLDGAEEQTKMALARFTYIKRNKGMSIEQMPLDTVPKVINDRGAVLEAETKRKFPNMKPDEISKIVRRNLAQEFGLIAD